MDQPTPYQKSWLVYRRSDEFKRAWWVMRDKGHLPEYIENILRGAFDAGYRKGGNQITLESKMNSQ